MACLMLLLIGLCAFFVSAHDHFQAVQLEKDTKNKMAYLTLLLIGLCAFYVAANDPIFVAVQLEKDTKNKMAHLTLLLIGLCAFYVAANDPLQACSDTYPTRCPSWKNSGYCVKDIYKNFMKFNCKKSCGYCGAATTSGPPTTPACRDVQPNNCPGWKRYCSTDRYKDYMRKNCYKTCGYCGDATRPPVTTKPGPVTTKGPVTGSCGQPEIQQGRVIAGENAKRGAWPWQILMLYNGRTMCGGSLVSPNWVVTAAHCVSGRERQASYFTVRVGEHITSTTSDGQHQDIQVEKIISHPSYAAHTLNNDIALMKLKTPVKFGKYIKPVCLPNQDQHVPVGTECYITGWGKIQHPGNMHHTLQQGKMPVVSKTACTNMNTKNLRIKITDQMVCAGHGGTTRVSGCHGDSGGPFVCQTGANGRWVLHGAVSWGSGRCDATQGYSVFARVAVFRSWLDQTMASN